MSVNRPTRGNAIQRAAAILLLASGCVTAAAELAGDQRQVADRYDRLEAAALRIADLAEESDPARAEQVRETVRRARELGVRERFDQIVMLLEGERLSAAQRDQTDLSEQLGELLRLMLVDPNEARLEEQRRRIERLARELRSAIRKQRSLRSRAERAVTPSDTKGVGEAQGELADRVAGMQELAPENPPGAPSPQGEGEPSAPSQSPPSMGGKIAASEEAMRKAQKQLGKGEHESAGEQQLEAQRELEAALREAEERLKQLREEEQQRRLAGLAERLEKMLAQQRALRDSAAQLAGGDLPSRAKRLAAADLAQRQSQVIVLAQRARDVVREDGASLTFDEALGQAIGDMRAAERRLSDARLDTTTGRLLDAVVAALEEMLAAVDESLKEMQRQAESGSPPKGGGGGDSSLVSRLAELRMLRSMQVRVRERTTLWGDSLEAGEASEEEAAENLRRLAAEQLRLADAASHAADSGGN